MVESKTRLIFLVSLPRSGSTLVQAILGTHSRIHTLSEPWIALGPISLWRERAGEFDFNFELSQRTQRAFFADANISEKEVQAATREYLTTFYRKALEGTGKDFFLDKTPRYYEILPQLHEIFPHAKFVLLRRDPLDILVSILRTWVKDDHRKLFYYQRDLLTAIAKINRFHENQFPNVATISLEGLRDDPEGRVSSLCEFIGVEFEPRMLRYDSRVDWEFGDQKFKQHNSVDQSDRKIDLSTLSAAHQQFLKCYINDLDREESEAFGYAYEELAERVAGLAPDQEAQAVWKMVTETPQFRDFRTTRLLLDRRLEERKATPKGWRKLLFWKH